MSSAGRLRLAWRLSVAYLAVAAVVRLLPIPERPHDDLDIILLLPPIAFAVAACVWAARRALGRERLFWRLYTITAASFLAGMTYRAYAVIAQNRFPAAGSFEDIAFIVGFAAQVPALILFADVTTVTRQRRVRSILDFVAVVVMALGLIYLLVFDPLGHGGESASALENLVFAAFPVFSIAFVAYVAVFKRGHWSTWERLVFAGIACSAAGTFVTALGMPLSFYGPGTAAGAIVNLAWSVAFICLALAAIVRVAPSAPVRGLTPVGQLPEWPGVVVSVQALAVLPLLIIGGEGVTDSVNKGVILWSAAALAMVVVARSIIYSHEVVTLRAVATVDQLTGLGNRRAFQERLAEAAIEGESADRRLSLCIVDVRDFEALNLRLGYRAGDEVLRELAAAVTNVVDDAGGVYRIGGDDLAVLLPGADAAIASDYCLEIAAAAAGLVAGEFIEVVCGIAAVPEHTREATELLRFAEGATYWGKAVGRDQIVVYDPEIVDVLDSREHVARVSADTQSRMVAALAAAVDARDAYTEEHSRRVATNANVLATRVGVSGTHLELLRTAALLHDVGKVGVPDAILLKPGTLTNEERRMAERHADLGERILQRSAPSEVCSWVRWHHERWDGLGYPDRLRRERIPVEARILCLCDAYDAMRTDRPYRAAMSRRDAREELRRGAGSQFDPRLVDVYIECLGPGEGDGGG